MDGASDITLHPFDYFNDDGSMDMIKFQVCMEEQDEDEEWLIGSFQDSLHDDLPQDKPQAQKKTRREKGKWCETEQRYIQYDYKDSIYWRLYVESANSYKTIPSQMKEFRNRFRVPLQFIEDFCEEAKENNYFPNAEKADCTGRVGAPLMLLLLLSFRYP